MWNRFYWPERYFWLAGSAGHQKLITLCCSLKKLAEIFTGYMLGSLKIIGSALRQEFELRITGEGVWMLVLAWTLLEDELVCFVSIVYDLIVESNDTDLESESVSEGKTKEEPVVLAFLAVIVWKGRKQGAKSFAALSSTTHGGREKMWTVKPWKGLLGSYRGLKVRNNFKVAKWKEGVTGYEGLEKGLFSNVGASPRVK